MWRYCTGCLKCVRYIEGLKGVEIAMEGLIFYTCSPLLDYWVLKEKRKTVILAEKEREKEEIREEKEEIREENQEKQT